MAIPVNARDPQPANGGVSTGVDIQVSWRSGREAVSHDVVLSTDLDAIVSGTAALSTVSDAGYNAVLDYGLTYYWQVTEVNEAALPSAHVSDIWSFTTPEYDILDDIETYSGLVGNEVFLSWVDGYGGDTTLGGSTTGYSDAPFVETSIVNPDTGSNKSLPIFYKNDGNFTNIDGIASSPRFSAVKREFESTLDVTRGNAEVLAVSFHGCPAIRGARGSNNDPDPLYITVEDSTGKTVTATHPDVAAVWVETWQDWLIPISTFNALELNSIRSITIGVGYPDGSQAGSKGTLYIDDLRIGTPNPE